MTDKVTDIFVILILAVANQQPPAAQPQSPVRAANGWEGSLPDTFRQTERKGSAKLTGDERSHPAFEDDFTACRKIA